VQVGIKTHFVYINGSWDGNITFGLGTGIPYHSPELADFGLTPQLQGDRDRAYANLKTEIIGHYLNFDQALIRFRADVIKREHLLNAWLISNSVTLLQHEFDAWISLLYSTRYWNVFFNEDRDFNLRNGVLYHKTNGIPFVWNNVRIWFRFGEPSATNRRTRETNMFMGLGYEIDYGQWKTWIPGVIR